MAIVLDFFKKKNKIKALIVHPNKVIKIQRVPYEEGRFSKGKKTYIVDEKAVYYYKNEPFLFYHYNQASPQVMTPAGFEDSMTSAEMRAVIEMDAVNDLLTATGKKEGWTLYVAGAAAVFSLVLLLIEFGVINVAKGG
jgi:hypothetical protein